MSDCKDGPKVPGASKTTGTNWFATNISPNEFLYAVDLFCSLAIAAANGFSCN
jgi:hypothetical protein